MALSGIQKVVASDQLSCHTGFFPTRPHHCSASLSNYTASKQRLRKCLGGHEVCPPKCQSPPTQNRWHPFIHGARNSPMRPQLWTLPMPLPAISAIPSRILSVVVFSAYACG